MENLLYVPVSSQNFNSVFSTESISPGCFYKKRKFGSKRFYLNSANPSDDITLLYNFLPEATPISESDETYIFYIGVHRTLLNDLIEIQSGVQEVWGCTDTIFLNFVHPVFLFISKEERNIIVAKSLASFESKTIEKFSSRFYIISEVGKECVPIIGNVFYQGKPDALIDEKIRKDELINSFKGLIYCQAISKSQLKSNKEIQLRNAIRALNNAWGAYASALSITKDQKKYNSGNTGINQTQNLLNTCFDNFVSVVSQFVPAVDINQKINTLLHSKNLLPEEIDTLFSVFDRLPEVQNFLYVITEKSNPSIHFEIRSIRNEIEKVSKIALLGDAVTPKVKEKLYSKLQTCCEKTLDIARQELRSERSEIEIGKNYFVDGDRIRFQKLGDEIDEKYAVVHESIINMLRENNRGSVGEVTMEQINGFIVNVGNIVKEIFGDQSSDRLHLVNFYQFINGKQLEFDLKQLSSSVLESFGAFVIKNKSLEELMNFGEQKYLIAPHIALEYWGVFNGFAAIGKSHTRDLMNDAVVNQELDKLLKELLEETLPYLKQIPTNDIIDTSSIPINDVIAPTFESLFEPIMKNRELQQFATWIEACVERCVSSVLMDFDGMTPEEALKKDLSLELFDKRRPKGFKVGHVEKITASIDFDLFQKLRKEKQKLN
jgi:hypothetical protein